MNIKRKKISLVYASNYDTTFKRNKLLHLIIAIYVATFIALSIKPVDRFEWWFESIVPLVVVLSLTALYRKAKLTNFSYICIFVLLILHTVGSHYTYSLCPVGIWMKNITKFERNNYDRLVSFAFGLLFYFPVIEVLYNKLKYKYYQACVLACIIMLSISAINEMVQVYSSIALSKHQADIFLGFQGDIFDCQNDMAMLLLGSVIAMGVCVLSRYTKSKRIHIVKDSR